MAKGCTTLGGHVNVLKELWNTEIRFGGLVDNNHDGRMQSTTTASYSNGLSDTTDVQEAPQEGTEAVVESGRVFPVQRAGFGIAQDVRPLRKRVMTFEA
jgi:hypothetical protein